MWIKNLTGGRLHIPDLGEQARIPAGDTWYEVEDSAQNLFGIKQGVARKMLEISFNPPPGTTASSFADAPSVVQEAPQSLDDLVTLDVTLLTPEQVLQQLEDSSSEPTPLEASAPPIPSDASAPPIPSDASIDWFALLNDQPEQLLLELDIMEGEIVDEPGSGVEYKLKVNDLYQYERDHQNREDVLTQLGAKLLP